MSIRLQKCFDVKDFTFERLGREFKIFAIRGPRGIPDSLSRALHKAKDTGLP